MADYEVVDVKVIGSSRLAVKFADGLQGEVKLGSGFFHGVFEALRDASLFMKVRCDNGFVEWPGDLDLAPDAMYDAIKESGVWVLES